MSARATIALFACLTVGLGAYFGAPLVFGFADGRGARLLPGVTSAGHAPIQEACDRCHTPFGGVTNAACNRCHGEDLGARNDSHSESKFGDPRNAERVASLDARRCATCHREHAPERTRTGGVTLPADFCWACHRDIGEQRPSHLEFPFEGCAQGGCHRFHDNRSLYEDFLAQHLREPEVLRAPSVPPRVSGVAGGAPLHALDADGPLGPRVDPTIVPAWEASAHARARVNCTGCHEVPDAAAGRVGWRDRPGTASCPTCHGAEQAGFLRGKHGMRTAIGLSPMTSRHARLPMKPGERPLGCESCHSSHSSDTRRAALEACVACHDDRHSRAYPATRHAALLQAERDGRGAPGTGVSCATCHLPREVHRQAGVDRVGVNHDQNANLRPNDAMVRTVCLRCHGLGFTMDSLADRELVQRNFNGRPAVHVGSLEMVERRRAEAAVRRGGEP